MSRLNCFQFSKLTSVFKLQGLLASTTVILSKYDATHFGNNLGHELDENSWEVTPNLVIID
jgi:hypothetical protein